MQPQPQEQEGFIEQSKIARNLALVVLSGLARTWEVLLRRRFGEHYLSGNWVLAITAIGLVVALFLVNEAHRKHVSLAWRDDPTSLLWFFGGFCLVGILHRMDIRWRSYRGDAEHSRYTGLPWAMRVFRRSAPENFVKCFFEPVLALGIALLVQKWNGPLGNYLLVATAALFVHANAVREQNRQMAVKMLDAEREMEVLHDDTDRMAGRGKPAQRRPEVAGIVGGSGKGPTVGEAIDRLPPELKRLLDGGQGGGPS